MITIGGEKFNTGDNPSAEGDEEAPSEDTTEKKIDVIHNFDLQSSPFDKKSFQLYMKDILSKLKERVPADQQDQFKAAISSKIKEVLADFDSYTFFTGTSMDPESMVVLMHYQDDETPVFTYFKNALIEEKY